MSGLHRSSTDKMFFGVCGGIAQHLGISSFLVRVLFVILPISIIAYLLMAVILTEA
ncbi:PspC domain-containing protein [Alkalihalobacillus trypoxylicola]|uniref:PspC domain-containing protein n=1 Tax=Alkalihalobacillus trypoxylicola TaxID=519424 RepID=UPI000433C4A9|nr:PspC domain-containing protein [Alkalihalobacillus trypoxylicola]GAF66781.1 phage shock protein C [Bacillus sp. TS-2]